MRRSGFMVVLLGSAMACGPGAPSDAGEKDGGDSGSLTDAGAEAGEAGTPAQCFSRSDYLQASEICGSQTWGFTYDTSPSFSSYFVEVAGASYLIGTMSNDLGAYDVASPIQPNLLARAHIPWDWSTIGGEGTHGVYNNHLRDIATTTDFAYGLTMLGGYGWDLFKLAGKSSGFLGHGYRPAFVTTEPYQSAALFTYGNEIWAAAQKLDTASINAGDSSIRLYQVGVANNPAFTEALTPSTLGGGVVVPIGHAGDPLTNAQFSLGLTGMRLFILVSGSKTFLIARSAGVVVSAVAVVDVSNPHGPQFLASSSDARLATSNIAADQKRTMLWAGDQNLARVYGYQVDSVTGAISNGPTVDYIAGAPSLGGVTLPSVAGDLLVAVGSGRLGYVNLAGAAPVALTDGGADYSDPTRVCLNGAYGDACSRVTAFVTGNHHYVCRSLSWDQDVVAVDDSCL